MLASTTYPAGRDAVGHDDATKETAMAGVWIGADTGQLHQLGMTFKHQVPNVTQIMTTIDGALNSTVWQGPAKDRFVEEWNGSFKQALSKLNEAFEIAGNDCIQRSEALAQVMGR